MTDVLPTIPTIPSSTPSLTETITKPKKTVTRKKKVATDSLPPTVVVTPVLPAPVEEGKSISVVVKSEVLETPVAVEAECCATEATGETNEGNVGNVVVEEEKKKATKRVATKEKLLGDMDNFYNKIKPILEGAPGSKQNLKDALRLQADMRRILKIRNPDKKAKDNTNSGFMKPIRISEDLRQFLELDQPLTTEPITRAYLTTRLCNYIKKNNLQNPDDKRIIFPDKNLVKLFGIQDNETEPLTYYNIQKRIQKHIFKIEEEVAPSV